MKAEEQIFSLMAIAEEQQRLVTKSIEHQERSMQILLNQQQNYVKELQSKQLEVQKEFERQVNDLNRKLSDRIGWSKILLTFVSLLALVGLIVGGATLYLRNMQSELSEAQASLRDLGRYNADLSACTHEGERYPCVRVMRTWGSYGEDSDYFILDPK
tara:strand:+ start:972 stop:1445 length:474 start_codon:yes stop_codon:yes gene_type:complete